jgi:hypothetical protein
VLAALLAVIPKARRRRLRLLVTPDTILRWHRDIVRRRWAARSAHARTGRPATRRNIQALVRRLARENPEWGYRRIHGELAGADQRISPGRMTWTRFSARTGAESRPCPPPGKECARSHGLGAPWCRCDTWATPGWLVVGCTTES